jgi:hypothetical protein
MRRYPTHQARPVIRRGGASAQAKAIAAPHTQWWWLIDQDDLTIAIAAVASAVAISLALM